MPSLPEPVLFALGPEVDETRIARWLPGVEAVGPWRTGVRTLMDTFDGRLNRRGLTLWREGRNPAVTLRMEGPDAPSVSIPCRASDPGRLLAADLPPGLLGERLVGLIEERALLPRVGVKVRSRPLRLCNPDGKTVMRLALQEATVAGPGRAQITLGRRLQVSAVLGYEREWERALKVLERRLARQPGPLGDEALVAAGRPPGGVTSDVDVALAADMRADHAMAGICRRLAEVVEANRPGTLADLDTEFLHDLRVAIRRSRSVLKEMRGVLSPEQSARARGDLRWIQEITGPTRDLDVLLASWPTMVAPVPAIMSDDLQPLVDLLHQERADAFAAMRNHLRSRRFQATWSGWRSLIAEPEFEGLDASRPIGELAGGRIRAVYRSMTRAGSQITDDSPAEALHELRKRGKELRYLLELFGAMWATDRVKPLVGALKGLQDVLGHFQDDEIQVHELRSLGPALASAPGGTDSLIALGFVIEELVHSQQQARRDFARRFAEFAAPANRIIVERTFR